MLALFRLYPHVYRYIANSLSHDPDRVSVGTKSFAVAAAVTTRISLIIRIFIILLRGKKFHVTVFYLSFVIEDDLKIHF